MINCEEGTCVIFLFFVFAWYVLSQKVQSLVSTMARDLFINKHFQQ